MLSSPKINSISVLSNRANGGKHRAINHGVAVARGELFFIVDSDDSFPSDSLELIYARTYR
jgi:glycosyltransferase involved in cell wall biosynthesis